MTEVDVGIAFAPAASSIRPAELGREVEARGFSRLLATEHTHVPVNLASPNPTGGDVPLEYRELFDQILWLAAAAAATTTLVVGTGVTLIAQHDVISLAKQIATLDQFSGGRLLVGIGYGWQLEEARNHGIDPTRRRGLTREKCLAMKALWTADVAEFSGSHVQITPSWFGPKPIQCPHPPIFLGASAGSGTFGHLVEFCDGWLIRYRIDRDEVDELQRRLLQGGREPRSLQLAVHRVDPDPANIVAQFESGASFITLGVTPGPRDDVLRQLDRLRSAVDAALGR